MVILDKKNNEEGYRVIYLGKIRALVVNVYYDKYIVGLTVARRCGYISQEKGFN